MIKVGVTGGIGSGKTTFCKEWEKLGAYVLYADDFAKELMVTDAEIINKIKDAFGEESYTFSGDLNRAYLAQQAFEKNRVEELNSIVHPVLWQRTDELILEKEKEGYNIFLKEAAILLNNGRPKDLDYVVLLKANKQAQIERVKLRDRTTETLVLDRLNKQPDFERLEHLCDFIVDNSGTIEELKIKAKAIFEEVNSKD
ncbi:MAG: dephospho-CoA kinase [Balneolaceae bacterium]